MEISSVSPPPAKVNTSQRTATVDYESFLHLLVAQLKHQDPTNPSDGTQFLSQLASFSSVEQGVQSNAKLDSILQSTLLSQANDVIGRRAASADGLTAGTVKSVSISGDALLAQLDNGKFLPLTSGVVIS
ncbi:MAG: flagellar hook assembly protein FlgD [Beijerinckiaceae bacterium]|nr:flagellar hook assembly protein FlgD [Beijerinckiaceae bacterium]